MKPIEKFLKESYWTLGSIDCRDGKFALLIVPFSSYLDDLEEIIWNSDRTCADFRKSLEVHGKELPIVFGTSILECMIKLENKLHLHSSSEKQLKTMIRLYDKLVKNFPRKMAVDFEPDFFFTQKTS